jgi:hypothetical protein
MYMIILNRIINDIRNVIKLSKLPLRFFKTISLTNDKKNENYDAKGATNLLPNDKEISSLIAPYTKDDFPRPFAPSDRGPKGKQSQPRSYAKQGAGF